MNDILDEQCRSLAIPKRITALIRDIWTLQLRLSRRQGKRAHKLLEQPKFRAAYDLLALRAEAEHSAELQRLADWWGSFQAASVSQQKAMVNTLDDDSDGNAARRRRRPRRRTPRREGNGA